VAKAARVGNHLQILSTSANDSVEDVTKARGASIWFQLYASPQWEVAQALIKRAEAAGCPVLVVTVDRIGGRNQETLFRLMREDTRECSGCHDRTSFAKRASRRHNYDGIDLSGITGSGESSNLSWATVKRMRDITKMKIVLKGILTSEDAELAAQNGMDGIIVSNHGGRGEDNGRSTIDALPEIIAAVNNRMTVIVDSGFRRGTDVVKSLAIGASHTSFADWGVRCALEGGLLMERQCDHLGSSLLSPLVAGNIRSTAPSHIFSAGSFSPAKWSAASFTKAAGRESLSGFR